MPWLVSSIPAKGEAEQTEEEDDKIGETTNQWPGNGWKRIGMKRRGLAAVRVKARGGKVGGAHLTDSAPARPRRQSQAGWKEEAEEKPTCEGLGPLGSQGRFTGAQHILWSALQPP